MNVDRARLLFGALLACFIFALVGVIVTAGIARAQALSDDGGAEWLVEQPTPPPPPAGVEPSTTPISLGRIGDIEFWAPNRGALITAGNGGSIPAGVWLYDGVRWRELASVCGASDGRIAWAGPEEFWTISDGRAGQAIASSTERPPLEDNTLCHFAPGPSGRLEVVASYASPAFLSTSYQAMHAAGCISPSDCWFAGDPLQAPQIGAFQLHWNGHSLEPEPYLPEGHTVLDMREFEGRLYESVRLLRSDHVTKALLRPPPLRLINPTGAARPVETLSELPLYSEEEFSFALDFLRLGSDGASLWAAAGAQLKTPPGSEEAGVTVLRKQTGGAWSQVIGPQSTPSGLARFPEQVVNSIAAEPGTTSAWLALDSESDAGNPSSLAQAPVVRIAADGTISDEATLPALGDPHGPLGAGRRIVCPATHDCWMTTNGGWLAHLATAEERAHPEPDGDPVFASEDPIAFRPPDEGVPQELSDTIPVDISGLEEPKPAEEDLAKQSTGLVKVPVALLSHVRSKLLSRTTLRLSFHLAVKARVRLIAKRRGRVVASTKMRTLKEGDRSLLLTLDPQRWPTKLDLQTHALAPLPTHSTREAGGGIVSTSLVFPRHLLPSSQGLFP